MALHHHNKPLAELTIADLLKLDVHTQMHQHTWDRFKKRALQSPWPILVRLLPELVVQKGGPNKRKASQLEGGDEEDDEAKSNDLDIVDVDEEHCDAGAQDQAGLPECDNMTSRISGGSAENDQAVVQTTVTVPNHESATVELADDAGVTVVS